jgi:hypothetical protein
MMVVKRKSLLRRIAALAAALVAGPALASTPGTELASWVSQHTDMPVAQVAIAGPDIVYGLEPLTPRLPTGEVIALVRTEAVGTTHISDRGYQSWDAHVLFDCNGGRMRVIRSATYREANRQGTATAETPRDAWLTPERGQPAAQLLHAACDASFDWPLRGAPAAAPPTQVAAASQTIITSPGEMIQTSDAPPPAAGAYAIQVAYGPNAEAATHAIAKAQELLGAAGEQLTASTVDGDFHGQARFTALLSGFGSMQAADDACAALASAGQPCFSRRAPDTRMAEASPKPAAAPPGPTPAPRVLAAVHQPVQPHARIWAAVAQGAWLVRADQPAPAAPPLAPPPAVATAEIRSPGRLTRAERRAAPSRV